MPDAIDDSGPLEAAAAAQATAPYVLRLFISGLSKRSMMATRNIRRICDDHLPGRYQLEVVDIYQEPKRAVEEQIVAAPTLVRLEPSPRRLMVGDMSDERRVLRSLGLQAAPAC